MEVQTIWSDDGIAIRLPEGEANLDGVEELLFPDADEVEDLVVGQVAQSALFASRFRENAARALLLPRRRPGTRTPLWQQRQRAADLLAVASRYGSFPILVETYRECLSDVFDLDALREILAGVARARSRPRRRDAARQPVREHLLFDYVAAYMYDGDAPLAERRAGALTLDRDLLRELLGQEELRELLDPDALADLELSLQALADDRQATTLDRVHDLLRRLGDLSADEVAARTAGGAAVADAVAVGAGRRPPRRPDAGSPATTAGSPSRTSPATATASASRRRSACRRRSSRPAAGALDGAARALGADHGPFLTPEPARRWGLPVGRRRRCPGALLAAGSLLRGEFRPGGVEREWCDPDVLRLLRRRSLARLRREVEPVDPAALGRFLPAWHGVDPAPVRERQRRRSVARPRWSASPRSSTSWPASPIPASVLERDVLPARIPGYQPRLLDELGAMGEVGLGGAGQPRPRRRPDRRCIRPGREAVRPAGLPDGTTRPADELHDRIREHLARRGASFYRELSAAAGAARTASCSTRCGTSCGPARSPTTRSRRSGRCAGSGRRAGSNGARRPRAGRLTALGPPEAAGPLVAGRREATPPATERLHAQALALLERHGVLTREAVASRGHRGRVRRRLPGPAGARGGRPDPARLLRRRAGRGAVRARRRARSAARRPRARAEHDRRARVHLLAAADPANPYGAALPWPRRGEDDRRPLQRAAGAYVVLVDGVAALYLERGGSTLQTLPAADDPDTLVAAVDGLRAARQRAAARASSSSARSMARPWRESPVRQRLLDAGFVAGYRGLTLRGGAEALMPEGDTLFRTAAGLRPYLVGREVERARAQGPGAVPQVARLVGHRVDAVESQGKNLLIRFDNGLELRTHLRMNGSWHRYRPGERWRRPPARARLVLEVAGQRSRSASTPPSSSCSRQRAETSIRPCRSSGRTSSHPTSMPPEAHRRLARPGRVPRSRSASRCSTSARIAGIGNVYKNEILWIERVSPFARVADARRRDAGSAHRHRPSAAAAPTSTPRRGPERITTTGDRGAPGPVYVYGRRGRPCRRCRTPIAVTRQGDDLPRSTYWCPPCQGARP